MGWALNFFLTANPYSAYKGGLLALDTHLQSDTFFLHNGLVMTISLLLAWGLASRTVFYSPVVTLGLGALVLASLFNGTLEMRPQSVGFDFTTMLLTSMLAFQDAQNKNRMPLNQLFWTASAFTILAIILAVVRPGIWGVVQFDFSRQYRTELIFAALMAAPLLMSISFFAAAYRTLSIPALLWVAALILPVAGGNRTEIIIVLTPALLLVFLHLRGAARLILGVFLVAVIVVSVWYFSVAAIELADIELADDSAIAADVVSGGRLGLLAAHLQAFANSPIVGAGAFFLDDVVFTDLRAASEVGVARSFSEYGIVWGLFQLGIAASASVISVRALRRREAIDPTLRLLALLVLTLLPHFLIHGFSRILTVADFLFWYAVFRLVAEYDGRSYVAPRALHI
jgi:hypothetical protein